MIVNDLEKQLTGTKWCPNLLLMPHKWLLMENFDQQKEIT